MLHVNARVPMATWNLSFEGAKVPPDMFPSEEKQAAKDIRASARRSSSFALIAKEEETRTVQPVS